MAAATNEILKLFIQSFLVFQQLKNEVVQLIRHNQNLSQQLDSMDIKIGLLIQNRITLRVNSYIYSILIFFFYSFVSNNILDIEYRTL